MKLVSVKEMQAIEKEADQAGLSYAHMMQNAGEAVAEFILDNFSGENAHILGLVGTGNNGGDALVAMTRLLKEGWQASALMPLGRQQDNLTASFIEAGGRVIEEAKGSRAVARTLNNVTVLLDGVLGTGSRLPLKKELKSLFTSIRPHLADIPVLAIDCPTGMDCDTGEIDPDILGADITLCMEAVKTGLMTLPAFAHAGWIEVLPIGLPKGLTSLAQIENQVLTADWVTGVLPSRPADAHKGTFGTAVICAGSINYTGAALLAAEAAYRVGSGLVTIAAPISLHAALAGSLPEATWIILPDEQGVISRSGARTLADHVKRATALLLGPGWGTETTTTQFLQDLLTRPEGQPGRYGLIPANALPPAAKVENLPPLVIDASGLSHLAAIEGWQTLLPADTILTPHPGEMSSLTGEPVEVIQSARVETARRYAVEWQKIVVLKGALTVVASPDGRYSINPVANAALARAGSGDVLAGLVTGLRAQGMPAYDAACAGVWLHAQCGLLALEESGAAASVLAGDLVRHLHVVLANLSEENQPDRLINQISLFRLSSA